MRWEYWGAGFLCGKCIDEQARSLLPQASPADPLTDQGHRPFARSPYSNKRKFAKTYMAFVSQPIPLGDYELIPGTSKSDSLTGTGPQCVIAGTGNDKITGFSTFSNSGFVIAPILSGGAGNDKYSAGVGTFTIIGDAGGGKDTINTGLRLEATEFILINGRDVLATDGSTTVLLIDPLGIESSNNAIEKVKFGKKSFKATKLYSLALESDAFAGETTYEALNSLGVLDFNEVGLNPLLINDYIGIVGSNQSLIG